MCSLQDIWDPAWKNKTKQNKTKKKQAHSVDIFLVYVFHKWYIHSGLLKKVVFMLGAGIKRWMCVLAHIYYSYFSLLISIHI